jgi:DNA invertase Pin-like site-specific DNA recombinase
MADKKTYIVNDGASFVAKGRVYKPGDEIDGGLFSASALEANIKGGKLLTEAQAKAKNADAKKDDPKKDDKKDDSKKTKTLDEMNLEELKAYAKEKNISTKNGPLPWNNINNRDELLKAIKDAEAENKGN